jgi:glutathione S-transferase
MLYGLAMILVGQFDSPFVRRVAISLHVLDLPFTRNPISVFGDADAMRAINPLGMIPSLVLDDGEVVIDSAAILDHLDEQVGPERALLPASGAPRRAALRIIALASGAIAKAGAIVYDRTLRPPDKQYAPWQERCAVQLVSALAALEAAAPASWLGGERPRQADITVGCALGYIRMRMAEAVPPGRYPALERHAAACEELAAFRANQAAADETMPVRPI